MSKKTLIILTALLFLFAFAAFAAETVTIINRTGYTIYYLKVSPGTADDWGDDWLGDDVLMDGDYISLDLTDRGFGKYCVFDIKAIDEDDDSYIQWDVDLCDRSKVILSMDDYVPPDDDDDDSGSGYETDCGYDQDVTISNDTGYNIWYVYISSSDSDSWGDDRLGDEVIMDGDVFDFCMPGYGSNCTFDIKIVDSDDDTYIKMGVDLCSTDYLSFTLDDLSVE
ncbi:MAG: hypothetical protein JEY99_12940 [Spirochaetales bacterium]|nr:hypothetical protein [Spirochaetales bacterium]